MMNNDESLPPFKSATVDVFPALSNPTINKVTFLVNKKIKTLFSKEKCSV
jgi:hypothetical protein